MHACVPRSISARDSHVGKDRANRLPEGFHQPWFQEELGVQPPKNEEKIHKVCQSTAKFSACSICGVWISTIIWSLATQCGPDWLVVGSVIATTLKPATLFFERFLSCSGCRAGVSWKEQNASLSCTRLNNRSCSFISVRCVESQVCGRLGYPTLHARASVQ